MTKIERPLCGYELSMLHRSLQNVYYTFNIAVKYEKTPFKQDNLKAFLSNLCDKWSQLVLQVYDNAVLRPLQEIKYDDLVLDLSTRRYKSDEEALAEIFKEFTNYQFKFNVESPLWKVLVYNDILFFVCDHVLFDGTAGRLFHQFAADFLQNKPIASKDSDLIFDLKNYPDFIINPSPIELLNGSLQPKDWQLPKTIDNALPLFDKELLAQPIVHHYSTRYLINKDVTNKLVQVARSHQVKLTSVLYGLVSTSLIASGALKDGGDQLTTFIPVNLRPQVKPQNGISDYPFALLFGKFLHSVNVKTSPHSFKEQQFWKYCQYFHKSLNEIIPTAFYPYAFAEGVYLANNDAPLNTMKSLATLEKNVHPSATLVMSNLGALNSPSSGKAWFDQSMVDAAFGCHIIGSPEGLCLNFTANRGIPLNDYESYVQTSIKAIESFNQLLE